MDSSVSATSVPPEINVSQTADEMYRRAADLFVESAQQAVSADRMFTVALSGGKTPRALYELLAGETYQPKVPWDQSQIFFSDERFVPFDSTESNYRLANDALFSRVPIPPRFVHPVPTENVSPEEAASIYEEGIRRILMAGLDEVASFDLVLLGLGEDGHTASLFPGTEALNVRDQLVAANFVPHIDAWRITFTYPLIDAARCVVFLVEGTAKAKMAAEVLGGGDYPAARVRPNNGRLIWLLDEAAASEIPMEMRAG